MTHRRALSYTSPPFVAAQLKGAAAVRLYLATGTQERLVTRKANIRLPVKHILAAQAGVALLVALVLAFHGHIAAYSALTGGLICVVANGYAAWRAFGPPPVESAEGALSNLYRAEVGKFIIVASLFIVVFAGWESVNIGAFLAGSIATMIVGIVVPAFQRVDEIPDKGQAGIETDG